MGLLPHELVKKQNFQYVIISWSPGVGQLCSPQPSSNHQLLPPPPPITTTTTNHHHRQHYIISYMDIKWRIGIIEDRCALIDMSEFRTILKHVLLGSRRSTRLFKLKYLENKNIFRRIFEVIFPTREMRPWGLWRHRPEEILCSCNLNYRGPKGRAPNKIILDYGNVYPDGGTVV